MNYKHGMKRTKLYGVWCGIKARCCNPNNLAYKNYGGRGIRICAEWENDFSAFLKDMGQPPAGLWLERIDNEKGYSKENCVWATRAEQHKNKRSCVRITARGETKIVADWARETGISRTTILARLASGWPQEDAVLTPLVRKRKGISRGKRIYLFQSEDAPQ